MDLSSLFGFAVVTVQNDFPVLDVLLVLIN